MIDENGNYSLHEILSYGCMVNWVISKRSLGKTFAAKEWGIRDFLKTGKEFVYLRRTEPELDDKGTFFDDLQPAGFFEDYEFKVHGDYGFIRNAGKNGERGKDNATPWRRCCFFRALTQQQARKGGVYASVNKIIFDEFIIEDTMHHHYLQNEVGQLLGFWKTVDRRRKETRVVMLSNAGFINNPYFTTYGLDVSLFTAKKSIRRLAKSFIACEIIPATTEIDETDPFSVLASYTDYGAYAEGNTFTDNNQTFISATPKTAKPQYALKFGHDVFTVLCDVPNLVYHVKKGQRGNVQTFCLTRSDMCADTFMLERTSPILKGLKKLLFNGRLMFETPAVRERFYTMLKILGVN